MRGDPQPRQAAQPNCGRPLPDARAFAPGFHEPGMFIPSTVIRNIPGAFPAALLGAMTRRI